MSDKDILWDKFRTCSGLQQFLKGCVIGCRKQWELINEGFENLKKNPRDIQINGQALLFNCFLYAFCHNQIAIILDHLSSILESQDLQDVKSEYGNHLQPFRIIANGMKHLNRSVGELAKKSVSSNVQFYNLNNSKLTFGDTSIECISEEPLKISEELYLKIEQIMSVEMPKLQKKMAKT